MRFVAIIEAIFAELTPTYRAERIGQDVVFSSVEGNIHKRIRFSSGGKGRAEILGTVYILSPSLFPFPEASDMDWKFEMDAQISCKLSSFIMGDKFERESSEYAISKSSLKYGEGILKLRSHVEACLQILNSVTNDQDIKDLVSRRPRYKYAHVFYIKWLLAVWGGDIHPDDSVEIARRDKAIAKFNAEVKVLGNYKDVIYVPGHLPLLEEDVLH